MVVDTRVRIELLRVQTVTRRYHHIGQTELVRITLEYANIPHIAKTELRNRISIVHSRVLQIEQGSIAIGVVEKHLLLSL